MAEKYKRIACMAWRLNKDTQLAFIKEQRGNDITAKNAGRPTDYNRSSISENFRHLHSAEDFFLTPLEI